MRESGIPYSQMSQGGVPGGGVVKLRKQIPSVECKFFDTVWNPSVSTISLWQQVDLTNILCGIIQGAGPNQRIGRKIRVVGIVIRGCFATANVQGPATVWTLDVIRDKQCNGVVPTAAQIYTVGTDFTSLPNPYEETRFQFLHRFQQLNLGANSLIGEAVSAVSKSIKCNFTVEYKDSTGAVSDLTSDNLVLFMNPGPGQTTSFAGLKNFFRVLYTDA